jgi:phosphopantetheinyl transferase
LNAAPLVVPVWPDCPAGFDRNGLALVLLALPTGTLRAEARRAARVVLRLWSGSLLALPADRITFVETPQGPLLEGVASDIRISLSYAGDRVLIGLAKGRALGVDLVSLNCICEVEQLSSLYLSKAACRAVLDAPLARQAEKFALSWAQMEACSKCLALPLAEIDEEREQAFAACELLECKGVDGYRMAAAVARQ